MEHRTKININIRNTWHGMAFFAFLCLFALCNLSLSAKAKRKAKKVDERIYLVHSDELKYDMFGDNPEAQIVKGNVHFRHKGANLTCDSAYFYQESNSMRAFGHVKFRQGDTLSLTCNRAFYDGQQQMMEAREKVVLKHHRQTLYTDSLNYDRLYGNAYFFEGGKLVDGKDVLTSDWGEYHVDSRDAVFYYNVTMKNGSRVVTSDTLQYNTVTSKAHLLGPSRIIQGTSIVDTENGYFDTRTDKAELYGRSTVVNGTKTIVGDSLYYNKTTGWAEGYGNVVYTDMENRNALNCEYLKYNEQTGNGYATKKALLREYSQGDTMYVHSDSMKIYTFNINTDSVYRRIHCFNHVKAYRTDLQAISDSLVFSSVDTCMTMYKDPIVWNDGRQLLGEKIKVYMNDSTVRFAQVIGQALSIEKLQGEKSIDKKEHFNQLSSRIMEAYFVDGAMRRLVSIGNVKTIYYPVDDKDTSLIGLNYAETDTIKMSLTAERRMERIWMPRASLTLYPITQIPPGKYKLPEFAWFEKLRPTDKNDVFVWRGKSAGQALRQIDRHAAPLQNIGIKKN